MKKIILLLVGVCTLLQVQAQESVKVKSFTLDNGLSVWINEDHSLPQVFGEVVVKAGAKNCPNTGIAHYFEHMMFKGTDKIGTTDFAGEKVYLDSIEMQYDKLAQTTDTAQRREIQMNINRLTIASSKYVIPNEFDRLVNYMGGSGLNAGTSLDYTVYYNAFAPQFTKQWLELYCERLRNPIFRLFQSELETVYEEKNMYDDNIIYPAIEKVQNIGFAPHPYSAPIVGTTEYLKNPRLSEMRRFFEKYYVPNNMILILCGDVNSAEVENQVREIFGKLPKRSIVEEEHSAPAEIKGRQEVVVKVQIPIVKVTGLVWRGAPSFSEDEAALTLMAQLFSNESGTGLLDKLSDDDKLLQAGCEQANFNEAGAVCMFIVPKLIGQSSEKAEKLVWNEIERIKKGDFDESQLDKLKAEYQRNKLTAMEDLEGRCNLMGDIASAGYTWEQYMAQTERIALLTKKDIVAVANKYLTSNYFAFIKKTGKEKVEHVEKPGFAPVVPPNKDKTSEYAQALMNDCSRDAFVPKLVDLKEDASSSKLSGMSELYVTKNVNNEVFTLTFVYNRGTASNPAYEPMVSLLENLGTDSLSYTEFKGRLQKLGATLSFEAGRNDVTVRVMGFDEKFKETMDIVGDFMLHVKGDKKKLTQVVSGVKIEESAMRKEPSDIARALLSYVRDGAQSKYFTDLTSKEIGKIDVNKYVEMFHELQKVACTVHYVGNVSSQEVVAAVKPYTEGSVAGEKPEYIAPNKVEKAKVYFIDMPKAKQSIIYSYHPLKVAYSLAMRDSLRVLDNYLGAGGMTSLLFQEIREFRSFAYSAGSYCNYPGMVNGDKDSYLITRMSTQSDKTAGALALLDSLLKDMPKNADKLADIKSVMINDMNAEYPNFRNVSQRVAAYKKEGYTENPNVHLVEAMKGFDVEALGRFYEQNMKGVPFCYIVVGNAKRMNVKELEKYGEVVTLKSTDVFKK